MGDEGLVWGIIHLFGFFDDVVVVGVLGFLDCDELALFE